MQNDLFPDDARKVGDKLVPAVAFTQADYEAAAAGKVTYKYRAGRAQGYDELTKKRARAVGMFEGWREVVNEPVRQRVGLAGMAASFRVD